MKTFCFVVVTALFASQVTADEIRIPLGQQNATPEWRTQQPVRGSTKEQIEATYGAPESRHGPTGDPPIYYWEYADFTVYFEGEHVIHAVSKHLKAQ
jgi:hypothetical protein